jgi:hypothetical protein
VGADAKKDRQNRSFALTATARNPFGLAATAVRLLAVVGLFLTSAVALLLGALRHRGTSIVAPATPPVHISERRPGDALHRANLVRRLPAS